MRMYRKNPVDGQTDGLKYAINQADWWTYIDGLPFIIENRDGVCFVSPDLDLLWRLADRNVDVYGPRRLEFHAAVRSWVESDAYGQAATLAFRLKRVEEEVTKLTATPEWPAARDAYRALLECAGWKAQQ